MEKQTAGRKALGNFAPQFAALNDDVLFGEVWAKETELSPKLRSIATVSALVGKGTAGDALRYHLQTARQHGVTKEEMAALLTHLAFYAGWPNAWAAFPMAKEVYVDAADEEGRGGFFGLGETNDAYAKYFTGQSYLKILSKPGEPLVICNVTFEPGCRNFWHIHHAKQGGGQVLICVDGEGWYQEEGKAPRSLAPGDIVEIPAGVKHWHGAKKASWFSYLAFEIPGTETGREWCEPVTDAEYPQE